MTIRYTAYTERGERVSGTLPVDTAAAAEALLWRNNLIVTSLVRKGSLRDDLLRQFQRQLPTLFRPKASELVAFTRQLGTLVHSGIPLASALPLMQDRVANLLLKGAVMQVSRDIQAGMSFSAALARQGAIFPPLYARLVTLAEETGSLEEALKLIAEYLERQATLSRKVTAALRYPAIVLAVGMVAVVVLITYSLPAMTRLLTEFGGELPVSARILIAVTDFFQEYGPWLPVGGIGIALALWLYTRTSAGARRRDAFLLKMPVASRPIHLSGMFRITKTLQTTLVAGLPLLEALDLTAKVEGNLVLRDSMVRVREQVLRGQSLSQALAQEPIFPPLVPQMVSVGEQSGTLTRNLEDLATMFDRETEQALTSLTGMIEPSIVLLVGGAVSLMAVTIVSSLYGVLGRIR